MHNSYTSDDFANTEYALLGMNKEKALDDVTKVGRCFGAPQVAAARLGFGYFS